MESEASVVSFAAPLEDPLRTRCLELIKHAVHFAGAAHSGCSARKEALVGSALLHRAYLWKTYGTGAAETGSGSERTAFVVRQRLDRHMRNRGGAAAEGTDPTVVDGADFAGEMPAVLQCDALGANGESAAPAPVHVSAPAPPCNAPSQGSDQEHTEHVMDSESNMRREGPSSSLGQETGTSQG